MAKSPDKAPPTPPAAPASAAKPSSRRVVVDPVTRIEGHLRIEAETDANNVITRASSSGTMVRGIEIIMKGRDPRDAWAFTQRFCGVCTVSNSVAAVRAVEYALGYTIPPNAEIIRNLMMATQFVHDHVVHFYHLHALDWVDIMSSLKADPAKTARIFRRCPGQAEGIRGRRATGHFRQWLLGSPRIPVAAGS
jgi:hydrogenase large subunit